MVSLNEEKHFNSIKVQLEQTPIFRKGRHILFQFHKGTIRTALGNEIGKKGYHFNSIKVQLEHEVLL